MDHLLGIFCFQRKRTSFFLSGSCHPTSPLAHFLQSNEILKIADVVKFKIKIKIEAFQFREAEENFSRKQRHDEGICFCRIKVGVSFTRPPREEASWDDFTAYSSSSSQLQHRLRGIRRLFNWSTRALKMGLEFQNGLPSQFPEGNVH